MTGVAGVGTARGDFTTCVIGLVSRDPQLITVVVLATAEIQIVAVSVAVHSQPGFSAGGSGKVRLQCKHEIGLITKSRDKLDHSGRRYDDVS